MSLIKLLETYLPIKGLKGINKCEFIIWEKMF